ncbi:MAG: polysaccharide deacetylase family protein [Desulfovermiculus sp.]|nr:polysaccharide deacetylase family protein [Desulfovermiculus sp.]
MDTQQHKAMLLKSAVVSIHDVMPSTLPQVEEVIHFLHAHKVRTFTLLIVPGKEWTDSQIRQLKKWQDNGAELAGHGWKHRISGQKSAWHSVHARVISRNEAEHLSRTKQEIAEIICRSYHWFQQVGLTEPFLYVPPTWAMGSLPRKDLFRLPFDFYETLTGVFDVRSNTHRYMPLTGYMSDTAIRTQSLKVLNAVNLAWPVGPCRVAIHPDDLYFPLRPDLSRHLARFDRFMTYSDIIGGAHDE